MRAGCSQAPAHVAARGAHGCSQGVSAGSGSECVGVRLAGRGESLCLAGIVRRVDRPPMAIPRSATLWSSARRRYLNYQSMIKQWLSERMEQELKD